MNCFLIDCENITIKVDDELLPCGYGDEVIFFYSERCSKISMRVIENIWHKGARFSCFEVDTNAKNALDFQLSSYMGFLIRESADAANYYIISEDKGYDCLCDFWQRVYGVCVNRISKSYPEHPYELVKRLEREKKWYCEDDDVPDESNCR